MRVESVLSTDRKSEASVETGKVLVSRPIRKNLYPSRVRTPVKAEGEPSFGISPGLSVAANLVYLKRRLENRIRMAGKPLTDKIGNLAPKHGITGK